MLVIRLLLLDDRLPITQAVTNIVLQDVAPPNLAFNNLDLACVSRLKKMLS